MRHGGYLQVESNEKILSHHARYFPYLTADNYRKTSNEDGTYNCIAYALGDVTQFWQPPLSGYTEPGHYWPSEAPTENNPETYRQLLELYCYTVCDNGEVEAGYEKVALYWMDCGYDSGPHVARQLESGKWSSKLGDWEDIEHETLDALEGSHNCDGYGKLKYILKRQVSEVAGNDKTP